MNSPGFRTGWRVTQSAPDCFMHRLAGSHHNNSRAEKNFVAVDCPLQVAELKCLVGLVIQNKMINQIYKRIIYHPQFCQAGFPDLLDPCIHSPSAWMAPFRLRFEQFTKHRTREV
jgi:hypothetical protein